MSKNLNKDVAKRIAEEAFDVRRELQFNQMMNWKDGIITGMEAIEEIVELEKLIIVKEKFSYYREQIKLLQQRRKNNKGKQ